MLGVIPWREIATPAESLNCPWNSKVEPLRKMIVSPVILAYLRELDSDVDAKQHPQKIKDDNQADHHCDHDSDHLNQSGEWLWQRKRRGYIADGPDNHSNDEDEYQCVDERAYHVL